MPKPLATGKELNRLRKKGLSVTAKNVAAVKAELKKEANAKATTANKKGMKAGPSVSEPTGYSKGGDVKYKKVKGKTEMEKMKEKFLDKKPIRKNSTATMKGKKK